MITKEFESTMALVCWELEPTDFESVRDLLASNNMGHCCPKPKDEITALDGAIREVAGGRNKLVVRRKKARQNGLELVKVQRHEYANDYDSVASAKVAEGRVEAYGIDRWDLQTAFDASLKKLTASGISQALVRVIDALNGRPLKKAGGIYFLPAESFGTFEKIAGGLNTLNRGNVVVVGKLIPNDKTLGQVKERFCTLTETRLTELITDLTNGNLKEEGVQTRCDEIQSILQTITVYKNALDDTLEGVQNVAELAKRVAAGVAFRKFGNSGFSL